MTQYNTLNVKLFNSQLNELESGIKVSTEVTSNFSSSMVGGSNDETNIPHKLLLTDTQVSEADPEYVLFLEWRSWVLWRK